MRTWSRSREVKSSVSSSLLRMPGRSAPVLSTLDEERAAGGPVSRLGSVSQLRWDLGGVAVYPGGTGQARLLIQARLVMGQADDRYEREAEQVAQAVLGMPEMGASRALMPLGVEDGLQRKCAGCRREEEEALQRMPADEEVPEAASSEGAEEEDLEEITIAAVLPGIEFELGAREAERISALRQGGTPLPAPVGGFFESRFGHDFSQVRLHTDARAAESARSLNARAYTVGRDIVFAAGQYAPGSAEGWKLLAHELAHVLQQSDGRPQRIARQQEKSSPPPARQGGGRAPAERAARASTGVTEEPMVLLRDQVGEVPAELGATTRANLSYSLGYKSLDKMIIRFNLKVSRAIQTTYKEGVNPGDPSRFGRGTTAEDEKAGNISLGFHERCHVADLQTYLAQNKLPEFLGKKGMPVKEFLKAVDEYKQKLQEYRDLMKKDSKERTDCVGTKDPSCE